MSTLLACFNSVMSRLSSPSTDVLREEGGLGNQVVSMLSGLVGQGILQTTTCATKDPSATMDRVIQVRTGA